MTVIGSRGNGGYGRYVRVVAAFRAELRSYSVAQRYLHVVAVQGSIEGIVGTSDSTREGASDRVVRSTERQVDLTCHFKDNLARSNYRVQEGISSETVAGIPRITSEAVAAIPRISSEAVAVIRRTSSEAVESFDAHQARPHGCLGDLGMKGELESMPDL
jgi:hypothetical protein